MNEDQNNKIQLQIKLIQAAKIADIETMYALTKQGADLHEPDETGIDACDHLALQDRDKAIELLYRIMDDKYGKKK